MTGVKESMAESTVRADGGARSGGGGRCVVAWDVACRRIALIGGLLFFGLLGGAGLAGEGTSGAVSAGEGAVGAGAGGGEAADGQVLVNAVRVEGNEAVATGAILEQVHVRSGAVYSEQMVADDARRILLMPQVTDVRWRVEPTDGGEVDVVFEILSEARQIASVTFEGNKHIDRAKIIEALRFNSGDFLDRYLVRVGVQAIEDLYRDKGYFFVDVNLDQRALASEGTVRYVIVEGPKLRIKKVYFVGNEHISGRKLQGKIKTHGYFPIFHKGRLDAEQLERDRIILQRFYRDEGYLDARVIVDYRFNEKKTRAFVTFTVEEGLRYDVVGFRFEGNDRFATEQLREALDLKAGKALTHKRRTFAERAIKRFYGERGYIYTRVNAEPLYTAQQGEVVLDFRVREGEQYFLDRLLVKGNIETRDKVVRRAFDYYDFTPGELYNTHAQERAEERLYGHGLFENVTVTPVGEEPNARDALVDVTEARTGLITLGVGVNTDSGLMGHFSILQRNFDASRYPRTMGEFFTGQSFIGAGQRLQLDFSPGTEVTTGRINFFEPYLFDQPYYLDTSLMLYRRWREAYLEQRRGGRLTLGRRFKNDWNVDSTIRLEDIRVTDLDTVYDKVLGRRVVIAPEDVQEVEGSNFLTSLGAGVGLTRTDNVYRPTKGYRLNADWEQVGALGGEFTYAALSAGGTVYHTVYQDITERSTVWAGSLRGSYIIGDAPVFERYYAGGIGSMRGFEYRGVSPRAGGPDYPVGSDYLFLANTELTHPLYEKVLYGKVFCDSGFVAEGPYRAAVGFGFELVIPQLFQMVPMHFDFGFPVLEDDKDEDQLFSFTFGLTF